METLRQFSYLMISQCPAQWCVMRQCSFPSTPSTYSLSLLFEVSELLWWQPNYNIIIHYIYSTDSAVGTSALLCRAFTRAVHHLRLLSKSPPNSYLTGIVFHKLICITISTTLSYSLVWGFSFVSAMKATLQGLWSSASEDSVVIFSS